MGLVKCSECGREISSAAKTCPQCGAKVSSRSRWKFIIGGLLVLVLLGKLLPNAGVDTPTAAVPAATTSGTPPPPKPLTSAQQAAAAIQQRKAYAATLDQGLLQQGLEVSVTTRGADATTLWIKYALAGRAWSNNMGNAIMDRNDFKRVHFKKLVFEDAAETTHTFDISSAP